MRLDVSVLDKRRRPVDGLTAGDFIVTEDGRPQEVVALSEVKVPTGAAARPVWARAATPDVVSNEIGDQRLFAIVLDGLGSLLPTSGAPRFGLPGTARNAMAQGVREIVDNIIKRLGPADVAAIAGAQCFQEFTSDRDALERVVDMIRPESSPCATRFTHAERGPTHILIHDIAQYLAMAPQRRKIVIYIGPGIDLDGGSWGARAGDDVLAAVKSARLGNVNIYTINTFALSGGVESERTRSGRLASLRDMAEDTGGVAIMDLAEYMNGLDQLFRENSAYYLLGYRTTRPEGNGGKRDITVRVNGGEGFLVRARSAVTRYKATNPAGSTSAANPSEGLAQHLEGLLPDLDVAFSTDVLPYATADPGKADVAIVTDIAEPVSLGTPRVVQRMDVRVIVYDERGGVSGQLLHHATIDAVPNADNQVRYRVLSKFALAPGLYRLRLVAQNAATNKTATMEFETTVPDFSAQTVSFSGVAIRMPSDTAAPPPSFGTLSPMAMMTDVPTAMRTFNPNTHLTASMRVYQGGKSEPAPVTAIATVLNAEGGVLFESKETLAPDRFDGQRSASYELDLPLQPLELQPGAYLLTFEATAGTRHSPRRDVRFNVR